MRGSHSLVHSSSAHAHTHQGRDARLLHRHAVDGVSRLGGGARIVSDHYELCVGLEPIEHAHKMSDVLIVERRVDFIEEAEWTGLGQKNSKEQRQRDEGLLSAREEMNSLCPLSTR